MGKKKILIVEDDVEVQEIYKSMLEDDYAMNLVKTVKEAQEYLEKEKPNLIILDIVLPKVLGDYLLPFLEKSQKLKKIPVIVITVLGDLTLQLKKVKPDIECMSKPFERKKLLEKIKEKIK